MPLVHILRRRQLVAELGRVVLRAGVETPRVGCLASNGLGFGPLEKQGLHHLPRILLSLREDPASQVFLLATRSNQLAISGLLLRALGDLVEHPRFVVSDREEILIFGEICIELASMPTVVVVSLLTEESA